MQSTLIPSSFHLFLCCGRSLAIALLPTSISSCCRRDLQSCAHFQGFRADTALLLLAAAVRAPCGRRAHRYLYYLFMSDAAEAAGGSGGADRPGKKQTEAAMLMASLGGPMEDEATARRKLRDAGFDPDSPQLLQTKTGLDFELPMTYFCRVGDLKMCRYLLSKGALATQTWNDDDDSDGGEDDDEDDDDANSIISPMSAAALGGHLSICKLLCEHGGRCDIRKVNRNWFSPLYYAVQYTSTRYADPPRIQRQRETYRWRILNEALCPNDDGIVDFSLVDNNLRSEGGREEISHMLGWAENAVRTHSGFMAFLMGTYRREVPPFNKEDFEKLLKEKLYASDSVSAILTHLPEDQQQLIWNKEQERNCELQCLNGHPGIRQNIADMLGALSGKKLRILRELQNILPLVRGMHAFLGDRREEEQEEQEEEQEEEP